MKQAIVAAENRTFWTDHGISIRGMFRAAWAIARGGDAAGRLDDHPAVHQDPLPQLRAQTLTRKFNELFLAYKINKELSKEQILEGYLNTIYFGHGAYGMQAASQAYFDIDAKQAHRAAGRVAGHRGQQPDLLRPSRRGQPPALLERYRYVISSMARDRRHHRRPRPPSTGRTLPKFPERRRPTSATADPRVSCSRWSSASWSRPASSRPRSSGGGLKIITTFDKKAQDAAVEAAQKYTRQAAEAADKKASNLHAAVASVDVGTRRGARPLRRPGLRQELPQLGHHAAAHRLHLQDVRAGRRPGGRLQPVLHLQRQHLHPARRHHLGAQRVLQPVRLSRHAAPGHRGVDQHRLRRPGRPRWTTARRRS